MPLKIDTDGKLAVPESSVQETCIEWLLARWPAAQYIPTNASDRIELLPKVCDGEAMLSWRDGRVLAILNPNGPVRVSGDETDTILGALASAIANAIPKESR